MSVRLSSRGWSGLGFPSGWTRPAFFSRSLWGISSFGVCSGTEPHSSPRGSSPAGGGSLLESVTAWRDSFFWALEGSLLNWVTGHAFFVLAWETLYHSAWTIELGAVFLLFVIGRKPGLLFVLVFYLGRLIGLVTPVMGPAFYRPDLFGYLDGTPSGMAMEYIARLIAMAPADVTLNAALLGGVSAMPSLHIAMVGLTAYWLGVGNRKTMFFTVPWVLTVWTSTVMLGWHYALDGAGGLLLAAGAIAVTSWVVGLWVAALEVKTPASAARTPHVFQVRT